MTGRSSTVCPFRFWKLTCELRSLGSSSISNLHSFPDQTPKPSSTDGGSPSITLIHPQNSAQLPRIQQPQQASRCTPTFHLESNRRQGPWTRSWRRELRNFLKSTLALRMFLPGSARSNMSHECLLSLVSSTAVSTPVFSMVAEQLSSMCWYLSSIRAASFSASFSSCLPKSRLHQDWASRKVPRSLTSKLMTGRSSTVCPFRFWKLTCELRSLGSSSISNLHSFPDQTPKPSSTDGGSPSITLIHPQNSARLPRIQQPQQASRCTPTFHLESNRRQGPWTRSWRRELRNFLKSTLALRMFLPGSARSNMSHECLLSLVSSTAVSTPVFSMVAEQLSSMCWYLSSIRAASFSASFSSCLPKSRLHQDWASRKVPRSLTSKLMTGRSSTVCPFRFWKLTCELRSLGSSSISNLHSFPDQTPKPSSTDGGSPSITLIHPQNSARLPRIQQPQQASRCTPTFHLESNRRQGPWTRSWRRELRNFLKSTLALRMFLPGSARSNMSHECLLSLVSSTAVSTPVFSMVAEHLSSMCSHLSSIRAARFSASFSSCLP
ncbi:uncharacterized protein [Vicugna pacos]|uniref:Uncharacterized protein n=1 Tax=Vicugna pacos TaxID=30538 RepID=A0ABM5CY45_VICPA